MKKKSANILGIISSILLMPYYAVYNFYRNLYSLNMGNTPFKSLTKPISGIPKISLSKEYSFAKSAKFLSCSYFKLYTNCLNFSSDNLHSLNG